MTVKIYGGNGPGPIGTNKPVRQAEGARKGPSAGKTDRVEFSAVLQQAGKARETQAPQDLERLEKVQSLKNRIASGTYRPDATKVAESLLKFLVEGKS